MRAALAQQLIPIKRFHEAVLRLHLLLVVPGRVDQPPQVPAGSGELRHQRAHESPAGARLRGRLVR